MDCKTNATISVAIQALREGAELCHAVTASLGRAATLTKKDHSPVTVADFGVQAVVSARLFSAFPEIPLVAEEDATALRDPDNRGTLQKVVEHVKKLVPESDESAILRDLDAGTHTGGATERYWALDPIDGTKGFLRGDQYAIALGLIDSGRVVLGVLCCPNLVSPHGRGCLFSAVRGGGATSSSLTGNKLQPIQVAAVDNLAGSVFCESVEGRHTKHDQAARIAEYLGVTAEPIRIDSQCKYAAIARGDATVYLRLPTSMDYEEKIWDHAAGCIIVEEAGGVVTDSLGQSLNFSLGRTLKGNTGVVATNGGFHDEVIEAVQRVLCTDEK